MAFRSTHVSDIEYVAEQLGSASAKLAVVAKSMRSEKRETVHTQLEAVKNHYVRAIEKLASDIERHYKDQKRCEATGDDPEWQRSQKKTAYNKALKESQANVEQQGLVKQPAKKSRKPKGS